MVIDYAVHRPAKWQVTEGTSPVFSRVYYVLGGEVRYTDEQGAMSLKIGHLYFFPTTVPYKMVQNVSNPFSCVFMHIDLAPWVVERVIDIDLHRDAFMGHLAEALRNSMEAGNGEIVEHLADAAIAYMKSSGFITESFPALNKAVKYISENFSSEITVEQLSGLCGYHPKYFSKRFSECYGLPPHQYIINYRLRHSCNMLKAGFSVSETAYLCGYGDPKGFCRAFKEKYGVSPKQFCKFTLSP